MQKPKAKWAQPTIFSLLFLVFASFAILLWSNELQLKLPSIRFSRLASKLNSINGRLQDFKFELRGPTIPQHSISIVAIDDESLQRLGRWPWDRQLTSELIKNIAQQEPRSIGIDILFSEAQSMMSHELEDYYKDHNLKQCIVGEMGSDNSLALTVFKNRKRIVLGWQSDSICSGHDTQGNACENAKFQSNSAFISQADFMRFALSSETKLDSNSLSRFPTAHSFNPNIKVLHDASDWHGNVNVARDDDGVVRRSFLALKMLDRLQPTLASAMYSLSENGEKYALSTALNASNGGLIRMNWRGPGQSFKHIPAWKILSGNYHLPELKNSSVIVGVTALSASDISSTPFDPTFPGPEIHANIIDNLLSHDYLTAFPTTLMGLVALLGILGVFSFYTLRLSPTLSSRQNLLFMTATALVALAFEGTSIYLNLYIPTLIIWGYLLLFFALKFLFSYLNESQNKILLAASFSRYVAPELVQDLLKNPHEALKGSKRNLSILFSDIRGFTTFSEKLDPLQLTEFLNEYFTLMMKAIHKEGGTLDKFIGDAIMCFWNAPKEQPNHASRAIRCGIEMLNLIAQEKNRLEAKYNVLLAVGIGINTGNVFVGNVGSESSINYTVLGDDVNLASRLEGLTKEFGAEFLIGESTMKTLKNELPTNDPLFNHIRLADKVKVKGKSQGIAVYEVKTVPFNPQDIAATREAQELYFQGKFELAKLKFASIHKELKNNNQAKDPLVEIYIERCTILADRHPENWDGVWTMKIK